MKILIHGNHITKSRQERLDLLDEAKKGEKEVRIFDGKNVSLGEVKDLLASQSLFLGSQIIFIDDLIGKIKLRGKAKNETLEFLNETSGVDVILWEGKEITKGVVKRINSFEDRGFKIPNLMFKFVDGLGVNIGESGDLLKELLITEDPIFIFSMIVRQIRLLLLVAGNGDDGPSDYKRLASWQIGKLRSQAFSFNDEGLRYIFERCLIIDGETKTGQSSYNIKISIERLLVDIYRRKNG